MHITPSLLLGLVSIASASSFTQQPRCLTIYASTSTSSVPTITSSQIWTQTVISTSTSTPYTTNTPSLTTTTSTAYTTTTFTTTLPTITSSVSTTTTVFTTTTTTTTNVVTSTATATSTLVTSETITQATSAGFTPLQSQIASMGYTPAKRNALAILEHPAIIARQGRSTSTTTTAQATCKIGLSGHTLTYSPARYPAQVSCKAYIQVVSTSTKVVIASSTVTKTAATPTTTVTTTSTISVTSTATPNAVSVTSTITTTSTVQTTTAVPSTATVTTTTTTTSFAAITTVYAVCQSANYLTTINGEGIDEVEAMNPNYSIGSASSINDCCNQCAAMGAGCAAGAYLGGDCIFLPQSDDSCSVNMAAGAFIPASGTSGGFQVFNTNCGDFSIGSD